jgi:hypothetical protein
MIILNLLLRYYKDMFARIWVFSPSIRLDPQYEPLRKHLQKIGLVPKPDGDPGGTILLDAPVFGEVEVYIIQRAHSVLEGSWTSPTSAGGRATILDYAQRNIGASNRLFVSNPSIKPDSARSTWSMVRVDAGTTCAQLSGGHKAPTDDKQYGP